MIGNRIGTDATGTLVLPNAGPGIHIHAGRSNNNCIGGSIAGSVCTIAAGAGNTIAFNGGDGVLVERSAKAKVKDLSGLRNSIRGNSIHSNGGIGIQNINGGNLELPPPDVTGADSAFAAGTACAGCAIDVFSDNEDEGRIYHGSTVADSGGGWTFSGSIAGPNVTATATDSTGNTSEFSAPEPLEGPPGADVEVVGVSVTSPANASAGEPFTVSADVGLRNNGPVTPAVVDTTLTPVLPTSCSATTGVTTVQDTTLPMGTTVFVSRSWTVTCTQAETHTFTVNVDLAIDASQPYVDPNLANNSGSGSSSTNIP